MYFYLCYVRIVHSDLCQTWLLFSRETSINAPGHIKNRNLNIMWHNLMQDVW